MAAKKTVNKTDANETTEINENKTGTDTPGTEAAENKVADKEKIILKFVGPYQRYAGGDIAGFDADVAKGILKLEPPVAQTYSPDED